MTLSRFGTVAALLCLLLCPALLPPAAATEPPAVSVGRVTRVFDGDTLEIAGAGRIRLVGVDSPEREASERDAYFRRWGIPPARLRDIHDRAEAFVLAETLGREVTFRPGEPPFDRHGRRLGYVFLGDGRLLNRRLLEEGLAVVYRRFEFPRKQDFLKAEAEARRRKRGLWAPADRFSRP